MRSWCDCFDSLYDSPFHCLFSIFSLIFLSILLFFTFFFFFHVEDKNPAHSCEWGPWHPCRERSSHRAWVRWRRRESPRSVKDSRVRRTRTRVRWGSRRGSVSRLGRSGVTCVTSVAILAQVIVVLFHCDHSFRFVLVLFFFLFAPMLVQRLSQQTTQQTSFIHDWTLYTPEDVLVPDITPDAQTSPISNKGSRRCNHSDINMCPPVGLGASIGLTGVCLPLPAHPLRNTLALDVRLSEWACRPVCRNKLLISLLSLPHPPSGCRSSKRCPLRLTSLLPTFVQKLSPDSQHLCPLSRQSPQGQQALRLTEGRPRPSPPARTRASLWRKKQKTTFF